MKYLLLLLLSFPAHAGVYIDAGIAVNDHKKYSYKHHYGDQIKAPMGQIEIGYEYDRITIFFQHTSSIETSLDAGLDMIG